MQRQPTIKTTTENERRLLSRRTVCESFCSGISEDLIAGLLFCCRRDCIDMSFRRRILAVARVTLGALKTRISFLLLELEIQNPVRRCFDVAASARASTRLRLSPRLRIERVERRDVVTTDATQARVRDPFVAELRGVTPAPLLERHLVLYSHRGRKLRIEIIVRSRQLNLPIGRQELMAGCAIRRGRLQTIRRVTGKAYDVCRRRLERALLQPECIVPQILWRLGHVLVIRLTLRLVCLMADPAALRISLLGFGFRLSGLVLPE